MTRAGVTRIAETFAQSVTARFLLAVSIVATLVLMTHPTSFIGGLLVIALTPYIIAYRFETAFSAEVKTAVLAFAPSGLIFVLAAVTAFPSAYEPAVHGLLLIKVLLLQGVVAGFYCVGRWTGAIDFKATFLWGVGILAAGTLVLVEEQAWFFLRNMPRIEAPLVSGDGWVLSRSFLLVALGLSFLLFAFRDTGAWALMLVSALLMVAVFVFSQSESARMVIVASVCLLAVPGRFMTVVLNAVVGGALILIVAGPFFYEHLLAAWSSGPFEGFMKGTFQFRMRIWADSSALIFDNRFLGRGLSSLEVVEKNRELFDMPHQSYGWHPHSAGLQVATDLGIPGMLWLGIVLWQVRTFIVRCIDRYQHGLIALVVMFVMVSFVADGLWQTWWWFAAAIIALWSGILSVNPATPGAPSVE